MSVEPKDNCAFYSTIHDLAHELTVIEGFDHCWESLLLVLFKDPGEVCRICGGDGVDQVGEGDCIVHCRDSTCVDDRGKENDEGE